MTVKVVGTGGITLKVAVTGTPPAVAVMVAVVNTATGVVVMLKVAEVVAAETVTVPGTMTLPEFEDRVTTRPEDWA